MFTRRSFLQTTAGLSAASLAGPHLLAANDTINVAAIGTGGRCRRLMSTLAKIKNVRIAAVCDIWDRHLDLAKKIADPKARSSKQYKKILERKEIDAVLIASPDHWHVPMTVDALAAGKHVYVEKPLTHDLSEGKTVLAAQKKAKKVVQVGTQQRSMPHIAKVKDRVKDGLIGDVVKVHMTWNRNSPRARRRKLGIDPNTVDWKAFLGNAPKQKFDEYRFRHWRWFWDFGGGIFTDLMVHWIDAVHWVLGLDHPSKAVSLGEFHSAKDVWEAPDTVQTLLSYPGGIQMHFEGTFSNARGGAHTTLMGTKGSIYFDRGGYVFRPARRNTTAKSEQWILGTGPRGADFYDKPDGEHLHLSNWLDAMRNGKAPSAPVSAGVSGAAAAHLANQAMRTGKMAVWKA